jgi:hypothetical protein
MAITRTQIARQLYQFGGGADAGGKDSPGGGTFGGSSKSPDAGGDTTRTRIQDERQRDFQQQQLKDLTRNIDFDQGDTSLDVRQQPRGLGLGNFALSLLSGATKLPFSLINKMDLSGPPQFAGLQNDDRFGGRDETGNRLLYQQMMAQGPRNMDNVPTEEEEETPFRLSPRFRAEGGSMNDEVVGGEYDFESAREGYKLGKLVKKVTRSVKKIAKSPVGKAAILGAIGFGIPGVQSGFFSKGLAGTKFGLGTKKFFTDSILGKVTDLGIAGPNRSARVGGLLNLIKSNPMASILGASTIAGLTAEEQEDETVSPEQLGPSLNIPEYRRDPFGNLAIRFRADGSPKEGEKGIMKVASNDANERLLEQLFEQFLDEGFSPEEAAKKAREAFYDRDFAGAKGGDVEPVAKKTMPLLDMGGQEMDLRAEGGFVPIGRMEKADDVPARLSKNEFVFTADAVRNAGEGDVDKGAEVMYNMMKNLESGGEVSEESQGLEGARKMFQTSQRLEEVL